MQPLYSPATQEFHRYLLVIITMTRITWRTGTQDSRHLVISREQNEFSNCLSSSPPYTSISHMLILSVQRDSLLFYYCTACPELTGINSKNQLLLK